MLTDKDPLQALQTADPVISSLLWKMMPALILLTFVFMRALFFLETGDIPVVFILIRTCDCDVPTALRSTLLNYFQDHPMSGHPGYCKDQWPFPETGVLAWHERRC